MFLLQCLIPGVELEGEIHLTCQGKKKYFKASLIREINQYSFYQSSYLRVTTHMYVLIPEK